MLFQCRVRQLPGTDIGIGMSKHIGIGIGMNI